MRDQTTILSLLKKKKKKKFNVNHDIGSYNLRVMLQSQIILQHFYKLLM